MKKLLLRLTFIIPFLIAFAFINGQTLSENIRINQVGYFKDGLKTAIAVDFSESSFEIWKSDLSESVYSGTLSVRSAWSVSCEDNIKRADFSDFSVAGEYVVVIGSYKSHPFEISADVLNEVTKATMKYYYFNRSSTELLETHAGKWARKGGHYNENVKVFEDQNRSVSMPGGWYDAGDYGLYMVTANLAVNQILMAYEQFPEYWNNVELNIPESNNNVPDILDEVKYELKWMYKMKDPADNGVWYKATKQNFSGTSTMPHQDNGQVYVMKKNVTSAYDFAGTFAFAARIFKNFEATYPGFADSCKTAALEAWQWAEANQTTYPSCENPSGFSTGPYEDSYANNGKDNHAYAAVEMSLTFNDNSYLTGVQYSAENGFGGGETNWYEKRPLATIQLALHGNENAKKSLLNYANSQLSFQDGSPYQINIGNSNSDFNWGSNRRISNRGMALMTAYLVTKDKAYLNGVVNSMDYVLGRNATGYCFITGYGDKKCMGPHHRISIGDGVVDPQPGLPIQGPYDGSLGSYCSPSEVSTCRAKNFVDNACSWVSSEITIDQASPHVFNLSGLMHTLGKSLVVDFTAPANGSIFNVNEDITLSVSASSDEGAIASVAFYNGDDLLSNVTNAPFSFTWENVPEGIYTITAIATDVAGNQNEKKISITVGNSLPILTVTAPEDGQYVAPESSVTISATANDLDGTISSVAFYLNGKLLAEDISEPYEFTITSVPQGSHTIKVVATDNDGGITETELTLNANCENLLVNGEFDSDTDGWEIQNNESGEGTLSVVKVADMSGDNALQIALSNAGSANWHVQARQNLPIENGKTYYISFLAKASSARDVTISVQKEGGDWDTYFSEVISLGSTPELFEFEFTADLTDETSKFKFYLGENSNTVFIDNVSITNCKATEPVEQEQEIALKKGWNLVSTYIQPTDASIASVFPNAEIVKTFNSFYSSIQDPYLNSLEEIKAGEGYLIYNSVDEVITISGVKMQIQEVSLHSGWNLIGVPSSEPIPATDISDALLIKDFDLFYKAGDDLSSLTELKPGKAYFVKK